MYKGKCKINLPILQEVGRLMLTKHLKNEVDGIPTLANGLIHD